MLERNGPDWKAHSFAFECMFLSFYHETTYDEISKFLPVEFNARLADVKGGNLIRRDWWLVISLTTVANWSESFSASLIRIAS
jgi:hypothetical protein